MTNEWRDLPPSRLLPTSNVSPPNAPFSTPWAAAVNTIGAYAALAGIRIHLRAVAHLTKDVAAPSRRRHARRGCPGEKVAAQCWIPKCRHENHGTVHLVGAVRRRRIVDVARRELLAGPMWWSMTPHQRRHPRPRPLRANYLRRQTLRRTRHPQDELNRCWRTRHAPACASSASRRDLTSLTRRRGSPGLRRRKSL